MSAPAWSRRSWLSRSSAGLGSALALGSLPLTQAWSAEAAASPAGGANRFPRMVHEAFVAQVREVMRRRSERLRKLSTRAEAEKYVTEVQAKIQSSFGPWPEKTPLNARVTGVVDSVEDGVTGILCDFQDEQAFFRALILLLGNPDLRAQMGRSGRAYVEANFEEAVVSKSVVDYFLHTNSQGCMG